MVKCLFLKSVMKESVNPESQKVINCVYRADVNTWCEVTGDKLTNLPTAGTCRPRKADPQHMSGVDVLTGKKAFLVFSLHRWFRYQFDSHLLTH